MRSAAASAVLVLGLALVAQIAAAQKPAGVWDPCGGINGPNKKDAAGASCPSGYACVRQDEYYWQCKELKSIPKDLAEKIAGSAGGAQAAAAVQQKPAAAKVLEPFAQCGGINGRPGGKDSVWPGVACPQGFECTRQDKWYYGCKELKGAEEAVVTPMAPLPTPEAKPTPKPATPRAAAAAVAAPVPKPAAAKAPQELPVLPEPTTPLPPQLPEDYIPKDKLDQLKKKGANATDADFAAAAGLNATEERPRTTTAPPTIGPLVGPVARANASTEPAAAEPTAAEPAAAEAAPVEVQLQFPGVTVDEFKDKYAQGSLEAVASVAGVPPSSVEQTIKPSAPAAATAPAAGGRRLLQAAAGGAGVDVSYTISAPDRAALLQRLDAAAADGGAGFKQALATAGVPLQPAVSVDGVAKVAPAPAAATAAVSTTPRAAAAPASPGPASPEPASAQSGPGKGVMIGAIVGAVGGALLLALLVVLVLVVLKRRKGGKGAPAADKGAKGGSKGGAVAAGKKDAGTSADANDIEMARDTRDKKAQPKQAVTAASESASLKSATAAGAAAAAALPAAAVAAPTQRVVVEPMAPAEAYPRSFPMDASVPPPLRTGAAAAAATASGGSVDLPMTPGSDPTHPDSFQDGEEQFATPRSSAAGGATSDGSFKSATGAGTSEASFRTAGGASVAPSFASAQSHATHASRATAKSARSLQSGASAGSDATSASKHESAVGFPAAFKPDINDAASDSSDEHLPTVSAPGLPPPAPGPLPPLQRTNSAASGSKMSRQSSGGSEGKRSGRR